MIRRTTSSGGMNRYDDDEYYDNRMSSNAWDGRERRNVSRSNRDDYDGEDRRSHHVDNITITQSPASTTNEPAKSSQNWFQANSVILGLLFSIVASGVTFFFDLYNAVRDLEYKQGNTSEKIAENRQLAEEIKVMIKEADKNKKEVEQQINSLEDTIMQLYRSNNKK